MPVLTPVRSILINLIAADSVGIACYGWLCAGMTFARRGLEIKIPKMPCGIPGKLTQTYVLA